MGCYAARGKWGERVAEGGAIDRGKGDESDQTSGIGGQVFVRDERVVAMDRRNTDAKGASENERFWKLGAISNLELEKGLGELLAAGARLEARVVAHLAEVEARRLHLLLGCSSMYDYCRKRLGLSDYEAFARIAAARVARRYPVVFGMVDRRELTLTTICEIRGFLMQRNHVELLGEVSQKTKLQVREILVQRFPQADVANALRKLPKLDALSPGRYRLELTLSSEEKELLERARDLMSHANPTGDLRVVMVRGLRTLVAELERVRFGRKRSSRVAAASSEPTVEVTTAKVVIDDSNKRKPIARSVRREVVARDEARCAFVSADGTRCDAQGFLQFHHRHAWAKGGADTVDNIQLLCHAHNRLLAEQDFGTTQIANCSKRRNLG